MAAGKYNVVFTYNSSKEKAHILQQELDSRFGGVLAVECDVTDPDSVSSAVDAAKSVSAKSTFSSTTQASQRADFS